MNRQLKKSMQRAFDFPKPDQQEKERFLKLLPPNKISMTEFLLIQAYYLRKRTVLLSILLVILAWIEADSMDPDILWIVSSFVPFLGILAVAESTRSTLHGMNEFEMSTRFSLKSVVLARMSILGLLDALILGCAIPLCSMGSDISLFRTGIYLFVPYLLTVNISLWITRHFHNKEVIYACISVAAFVSVSNTMLYVIVDFLYQFSYIKWWFLLAVLLIGEVMHEIYFIIKETEELSWN